MADSASTAGSIITIAEGSLRGNAEGSLQVFRGIPYAAPPVGERRWRPPLPAAGWDGVRDATRFGAVCPQILRAGYSLESLGTRPMSEDCLHANVWTPRAQGGARLPVMVWILPGSFMMGDGGMERYDGATLAGDGVVVVTFNYRLGLFGLFAHPALSRVETDEPLGNYHLRDQITALRWVRENIAAFGGEQHKVPYLTGATSWEGSLLGWAKSADPLLGILGVSRAQADALYAERDDRQLNNKLYADFFFGSQRYLAKQHALAGQSTYVYHFTRVLDAHQGDYYGAAHGAETHYVFGTLDGLGLLAGPTQPGVFGYRVGDADRAYAELVRGYWVQFARSSNPNGDGRPGWPVNSPGNDLLLEFGQQSQEVRRDFRRDRQQFWERHFEDGKL